MKETANYQLKKIELTDAPPDITVLNPNWDAVDGAMATAAAHRENGTIHFSAAERNKLTAVEEGANRYVHPATHEAAMILQSAERRFVSDAEKAVWNGKAAGDHNHDNAYMPKRRSVYTETGSMWLSVLLADYLICLDNTEDITVTVPNHLMADFAIGTEVELLRLSSGKVTVSAVADVTIVSRDGCRVIAPVYGFARLRKLDTDRWLLYGDLAAQ